MRFELDGTEVEVDDAGASLLDVLRERLGVTSAKDGSSAQTINPTPFTGPTQQPGNTNTPAQETPANPDTTGGMQAGNETDPVGAADPAMSSGGTSIVGGPDVSQLDPSLSPPSDNGGGEQPPQNAGGAGGTAATASR